MKAMYQVLKEALVERGWGIDKEVKERCDGELHEFVHPLNKGESRLRGKRMAFVDALLAQMDLEVR